MDLLDNLLENNRLWAEEIKSQDPDFFAKLARQQTPDYLWIGCADSRVPANQITGLLPGEVFVHRNIANVVTHTDINCLSVLQYAVEVLKVKHVIVCGHYGCGGVQGALSDEPLGLIDNWLRHIKDIYYVNREKFEFLRPEDRLDRLCELNVIQSVANLCHTTTVQDAWRRGQNLTVHGWIYSLQNGLLRDLKVCFDEQGDIPDIYRMAGE